MRPTCNRQLKSRGANNLIQQDRMDVSSRIRWPIFGAIIPAAKSDVPKDVIAGITLATLAIAEVMGYTPYRKLMNS